MKFCKRYQIGKRIAAIALPHLGGAAERHGVKAIGHMDHARGAAMQRFEDVQEKYRDHGRVFQQIRNQVPEARALLG